MIKRARDGDRVKVTFAVGAELGPTSVVGDFNDWDPAAHPLRPRSNGTRSVAVTLDRDRSYRFRYLADGRFFDEPDADRIEPNGYGDTHSVLVT